MTSGRAQVSPGGLADVQLSAARFFRARLPGSWVPAYLAGRGFGAAVQERWQAGYAPRGWDALTRHLRAAGYPDPLIEAAGLARRSRRGTLTDTFRDRAMLPVRSAGGVIVAFIGRAPGHAGRDVPKYLNSPGTRLYSKSDVLFGLWEGRGMLASGAQPVIVEGPFDAIAVTTACPGRYAGVAPCGAVLTPGQAAALGRAADLSASGVLVAFDPDQPGHRATVGAYHLLAPLTGKTAAVVLPAGRDPAQILGEHGAAALAWTLASRTRPLIDIVVDAETGRWKLRDAEGQIGALRATAPLVAALPPVQVARQVTRLAGQLGLDHAIVTEAVTDAVTEVMGTGQASARCRGPSPGRDRQDMPSPAVRAARQDSPRSMRPLFSPTAAMPGDRAGPLASQPASRSGRVTG